MTPTQDLLSAPERRTVGAAAVYVVTHAWEVFITGWNWKTALLSAIFRLAVWPANKAAGIKLIAPGALRGLATELLFRLGLGGFYGSLLQAFVDAQPAWLAGVSMAVILPGCAHALEYLALRAGGAAHAGALTITSIMFSALSLFVNWMLMRRGILVTGRGAASLGADLRRIFGGRIGLRSVQRADRALISPESN
jgi:hypothetical protein